jgi:hypothetical protein
VVPQLALFIQVESGERSSISSSASKIRATLLSLAQTKLNELLSLVQLYKALGGGWQQ